MNSLFRTAALTLAAVVAGVALPALGEIATNIVRVVTYSEVPVSLSSGDPSGLADGGAGGFSLQGEQHLAGSTVTAVWCELATTGSAITGGTVRWWKQTNSSWGLVPSLDETIPNTGEARVVSAPLRVLGPEGRVYCETSSVTETGGDGGLTRVYGFRVERK